MFRRLHLQMTIFCTAVTGLILVALSAVCLYISYDGLKKNSYTSFLNDLYTIFTHTETQSSVSHQWISQMEKNGQYKICLIDNGMPLYFDALVHDDDTQALFSQAVSTAKTRYALDINEPPASTLGTKHVEFEMTDPRGETYYASVGALAKSSGALGTIVLYTPVRQKQQLFQQGLLFGAVDLAALLLLAVFSFLFTRHLIHPLEKSRQQQAAFIAAASHELRTPLTVIRSCISAVRSSVRTSEEDLQDTASPNADISQTDCTWEQTDMLPEEAVTAALPQNALTLQADNAQKHADTLPEEAATALHFLDCAVSESLRMSHLIDDLLQLASADSHQWTLCLSDLESDTLLLELYEKYLPLTKEKQLQFSLSLPEQILPCLHGDGERLTQALSILLDNACSYTPAGGRISLGLTFDTHAFLIHVTDNGPGIPDAQKKHVFERFYRAEAARSERNHFGLGLSIAHEIIALHHGSIRAADAPGGGADFIVRLPV